MKAGTAEKGIFCKREWVILAQQQETFSWQSHQTRAFEQYSHLLFSYFK
jgi:hypothetical protein